MFIFAIVLFAIAALALLVAVPFKNGGALLIAIGTGLLGVVLTVVSSMHMVPVRNVGIVTEWKRPTGDTTGSGLVWTAPWQNVTDWDASRKPWNHLGDSCVKVQTATLAEACVETLIEYQVKADQAPEQYQGYRGDFEHFERTRINPGIENAVVTAFKPYDALANAAKGGNLNVPLEPFIEATRAALVKDLGMDIDIISVRIPKVRVDDKTQARIAALNEKIQTSRNLDQDLKNAEKQKAITETNAKVDKITRCLEIADEHGKEPGLCINGGAVLLQK